MLKYVSPLKISSLKHLGHTVATLWNVTKKRYAGRIGPPDQFW